LLFLVDEYELPIREGLLRFIPLHGRNLYNSVEKKIRSTFAEYFDFFTAVKVSLEQLNHAKIFLTGITPIGIKEIMSGLPVISLTFEEDMADAVGLTEENVNGMLDNVNKYAPFENGERDLAFQRIKHHFNNLCFPGGSSLYHTALVNGWMSVLLKKLHARKAFLQGDYLHKSSGRELVPSSVYNVLQNARNLRHVVNMLAQGREVIDYKLNEDLSLEHLLREEIDVSDYLTLLVHLGVASAKGTTTNPTFTIEPLLFIARTYFDPWWKYYEHPSKR
jgi:hypothetical protein